MGEHEHEEYLDERFKRLLARSKLLQPDRLEIEAFHSGARWGLTVGLLALGALCIWGALS